MRIVLAMFICVMILLLDNFMERNFVIDVILFYIVYTDIEKYYDKKKVDRLKQAQYIFIQEI